MEIVKIQNFITFPYFWTNLHQIFIFLSENVHALSFEINSNLDWISPLIIGAMYGEDTMIQITKH